MVLSLTCSSLTSCKCEQSLVGKKRKKKKKSKMLEAFEKVLKAVWHFSVVVMSNVEVPCS